MQQFPSIVRDAMQSSGATATCLPVQIDADTQGDEWESAVFFQVGGPHSKDDRRALRKTATVPLGLETDIISHDRAAVIVLRLIAHTRQDDPLVGEVLLTPGVGATHFQTLQLLTLQARLVWFFADKVFNVIKTQQMPFSHEHHQHFEELLSEATSHDAMIRMTSSYDAQSAISEIVENYQLRSATDRSEYAVNQRPTDQKDS